jgi:hypothetical protein
LSFILYFRTIKIKVTNQIFLYNEIFLHIHLYSFIVFINEVGNDVAQKAVNVAVDYVKKTSELGMSVEVMAVEGNRTDSKGLLESVCMKLAESIEKKTPPHVIFDTTKTGRRNLIKISLDFFPFIKPMISQVCHRKL